MARTLVTYFSVSGTTRQRAQELARELGADIEEIVPTAPYTNADLDWQNNQSRASREQNNEVPLPQLAKQPDVSTYDTILIGFPIWWYVAPRIIDVWVKAADLDGKTVIVWATSGGSGMGKTTEILEKLAPHATWRNGRVLHSQSDVHCWAACLEL